MSLLTPRRDFISPLCVWTQATRGKYYKGGALILRCCPPENRAHVLRSSVARQQCAGLELAVGLFRVGSVTAFQSESGRWIEDSALCQKQRQDIIVCRFLCTWLKSFGSDGGITGLFHPADLRVRQANHWCDIFSLRNLQVDPTITLHPSESTKTPCDDTLESPATLAPEQERSSPSPCQTLPPSPPSSPPPSPPPIPALAPHLPLPAVHRVLEDGEGTSEERAGGTQASPDSFCRVMGLLGMGHRLFVPRLLAVRKWGLELEINFYKIL